MIKVFKIILSYSDTLASVKLNLNAVSSTRGNKLKLRKDMSIRYMEILFLLPGR